MAQEWFYTRDGKNKIGPISSTELRSLAKSGELWTTDMVFKHGTKQWVPAGRIKGLFTNTNLEAAPHRTTLEAFPQGAPKRNTETSAGIKRTSDDCAQATSISGHSHGLNLDSQSKSRDPMIAAGPRLLRALKLVVTTTLLVSFFALLLVFVWFVVVRMRSPLDPWRTLLPENATSLFWVSFSALRDRPGIEKEFEDLLGALQDEFNDIKLQPDSANISSLFLSDTKEQGQFLAIEFDRPVSFRDANGGRFQKGTDSRIREHVVEPETCWAIDGQGRLLRGSMKLLRSALEHEKANRATASFSKLSKWAKDIPSECAAWGLVDFGEGDAFEKVRVNGLFFSISYEEKKSREEPALRTNYFCPSHSDALNLERKVRETQRLPFNRAFASVFESLQKDEFREQMLQRKTAEIKDTTTDIQIPLTVVFLRDALTALTEAKLIGPRKQAWQHVKQAYDKEMNTGQQAMRQGEALQRDSKAADDYFEKAKAAFSRSLEFYSESSGGNKRKADDALKEADRKLQAEQVFLKALEDAKKSSMAAKLAYDKAVNDYDKTKPILDSAALETHLDKASNVLKTVTKLRPTDDRIAIPEKDLQDYRERLKALKLEYAFDDKFCLAKRTLKETPRDITKVSDAFKEALEIGRNYQLRNSRPKEIARAENSTENIEKLGEMGPKLNEARKALKGNLKESVEIADKLADIQRLLSKSLENADESLRPLFEDLVKQTCDVYRTVLSQLAKTAEDLEKQAKLHSEKMELTESETKFGEAIFTLKEAEKIWDKLDKASKEIKDKKLITIAARDLDAIKKGTDRKTKELHLLKQADASLNQFRDHNDKGKKLLGEGSRLLDSKNNATSLRQAEDVLKEAIVQADTALELATKLGLSDRLKGLEWPDPKETRDRALRKRKLARALICPFDLLEISPLSSDWESYALNGLKAKGKGASLSRSLQEDFPGESIVFPRDFVFRLDFDLKGGSWGDADSHSLRISLHEKSTSKGNKSGTGKFSLILGRDSSFAGSAVLRTEPPTLLIDLDGNLTRTYIDFSKNPMTLVLTRSGLEKNNTKLELGTARPRCLSLTNDFLGISISVNNGTKCVPILNGGFLKILDK